MFHIAVATLVLLIGDPVVPPAVVPPAPVVPQVPLPSFNWQAIKTCAATPLPAGLKPSGVQGSNVLSPAWRDYEAHFRNVMLCRDLLAARHDGWVEGSAAGKDGVDTIGVEPMMNPDDFTVAPGATK